MRKLGFILPLMMTAAVVFGAETAEPAPKAKAPEKPAAAAKAPEAKAPEKPAAAAKADESAPIATPIPWFVPAKAEELESGMEFKVPAEGTRTKANMKPGESRSLLLKENAGGTWIVSAINDKVATVKQIGKDGKWVTFEITAIHPGRTLLEMSQIDDRNAPLRAFRCYIEVK